MLPYIAYMDPMGTQKKNTVSSQWPFQEPQLEVPTIYKAYVREYPHWSSQHNIQIKAANVRILPRKMIVLQRGFSCLLEQLQQWLLHSMSGKCHEPASNKQWHEVSAMVHLGIGRFVFFGVFWPHKSVSCLAPCNQQACSPQVVQGWAK